MAKNSSKGPFDPDPSRQSSEKTDPDYNDKKDAENLKAYKAFRTQKAKDEFLGSLTGAAKKALQEKLGLL